MRFLAFLIFFDDRNFILRKKLFLLSFTSAPITPHPSQNESPQGLWHCHSVCDGKPPLSSRESFCAEKNKKVTRKGQKGTRKGQERDEAGAWLKTFADKLPLQVPVADKILIHACLCLHKTICNLWNLKSQKPGVSGVSGTPIQIRGDVDGSRSPPPDPLRQTNGPEVATPLSTSAIQSGSSAARFRAISLPRRVRSPPSVSASVLPSQYPSTEQPVLDPV